MIDVKIFNVTVLMTNCCLLTDRKTGKMAVTDPGAPNEELNSEIEKNGGKLEYVILTHGHYDHISYAKQLAEKFDAKIVTGEKNNEFLSILHSILPKSTDFHSNRSQPIFCLKTVTISCSATLKSNISPRRDIQAVAVHIFLMTRLFREILFSANHTAEQTFPQVTMPKWQSQSESLKILRVITV